MLNDASWHVLWTSTNINPHHEIMKHKSISKRIFGLLISLAGLFILATSTVNPGLNEDIYTTEDKDDSLEIASKELLKAYQALGRDILPKQSLGIILKKPTMDT